MICKFYIINEIELNLCYICFKGVSAYTFESMFKHVNETSLSSVNREGRSNLKLCNLIKTVDCETNFSLIQLTMMYFSLISINFIIVNILSSPKISILLISYLLLNNVYVYLTL